jgi:hypothetical protein
MTHFIAESIFWGAILSAGALVYQSAVLPGIRLSLRYRTFALRDRLRALVMNGTVKETNTAFQLLHQNLNSMCISLSRYDLARVSQAIATLDEEARKKAEARRAVIEAAPAEIKEIYEESLHVFMMALTFNSLFFFLITGLCLGLGFILKVGILRVKDAVMKKFQETSSLVFFSPEAAAV